MTCPQCGLDHPEPEPAHLARVDDLVRLLLFVLGRKRADIPESLDALLNVAVCALEGLEPEERVAVARGFTDTIHHAMRQSLQ